MSVGSYIEIVQKGHVAETSGDVPFRAVFTFQASSPPVTMDEGHIATAFIALAGTHWAAANSVVYVDDGFDIRCLDDETNPVVTVATGLGDGTVSGAALPDKLAVYIRLRGVKRGRFALGSKHLGPIAASDVDANAENLNSGAIGRWQDLADDLRTPFTDSDGNTWTPTVLSREMSVLTNPTSITMTNLINDTQGAEVRAEIGTMRRRRVR